MTKVKICGITNKEDALIAMNYGSDFLGFIVDEKLKSKRRISAEKVRDIVSNLKSKPKVVVVMAPRSLDEVIRMEEMLRPYAFQLHGNETLDFIETLKSEVKAKIIKAIGVSEDIKLDYVKEYAEISDFILLDTKVNSATGGTGKVHDWNISKRIRDELYPKRVILAGGLKPENVKEAIKKVKPYAVDVSSGVELKIGKKDPEKIKKFIAEAKNV
ncbi:MAG: N-(5'-phosphoribosyl)anthranilate isomerase [Candidatus Altiarchaeales archaeon]|nr:MAG: N-(5'-phosphoribosyl)anthranilate isomerase [Candidatus Altiarchaeales archaeon]